jgi:signal transduction histidine kinase
LRRGSVASGGPHTLIEDPSWQHQSKGFSLRFQIIDDRVLHGVSSGTLEEAQVHRCLQLQERVLETAGLDTRPYSFILGLDASSGTTPEARKPYVSCLAEQVRVQEDLKSAKELAEKASQAKSNFLANMSHELRTPLNHIMGFTDLLIKGKYGQLNGKQEEILGHVRRSSRHLLALVNELLDLSKIEAGKQQLELTAVDLRALIQDSLIMVRQSAESKQITMRTHTAEAPSTIRADSRMIKQVLYNLLTNAVKFTPPAGRIDVIAMRVASGCGQAGEGVEIAVSDTGGGIAE